MCARLIALLLLASSDLLLHATANADIIRCNDANGNTLYTDSACSAGMRVVSVTPFPQSCTTDDCERRRERDLKEAYERVRDENEQLAAYTAERHKREIDDRWLDEARYDAQLRSVDAAQASPDETVYPAYPVVGIPSRCGMRCFPPTIVAIHPPGSAASNTGITTSRVLASVVLCAPSETSRVARPRADAPAIGHFIRG